MTATKFLGVQIGVQHPSYSGHSAAHLDPHDPSRIWL